MSRYYIIIDYSLITVCLLFRELSRAFSENDPNRAKVLLSKAKYFNTLLEKIKEINV